ncbi:MAG: hypothetical protein PHD01_13555 [Geobacteraceae bacterium]|nr:hypothetical protein [Geobacteraceae bacterium]
MAKIGSGLLTVLVLATLIACGADDPSEKEKAEKYCKVRFAGEIAGFECFG